MGHGSGAGLVGGGTAKASSPSPLATIMSPQAWPEPCENFKILDPGFPFKGCSLPRERMDVRPLFRSCVCLAQSCLTLCDPMDYSPPGSSVHGILQARILEWFAIPFTGDCPDSGIKPGSPALQEDSLPSEPPGKPPEEGQLNCPEYASASGVREVRAPDNLLV